MIKFMLDTNIAIYVIKQRPIEMLQVFNQHAGQLCISSITLAELLHGVEKSAMVEKNLKNVEDFISRLEVLDYGNKAAAHYGDIRADFVEALGLTKRLQDIDFHAGQEHANPSMPPELVEFLRRCNLLPMTYSAHRLLVDELRQLGLNWKKSKLPTNAWISGSDAVKLVQRFKQCNANIGQQYRGQARSFFEEPWPKAGNQVLDEELLTAALQHQIFDSLSQDCQNRLAQASPAIKNRVAAKAFMNKPAVDDAPRLRQVIMRQRHELRMLYRKIGELE